MRRARFLFWLDVVLLLVLAPLQEPRTTGLPGHEWVGIGFGVLLLLHLLVNWRWIVHALGRYAINPRRARFNAWLNGALYVTMAFTIFSGLVVSEVALPALGVTPNSLRAWRQLHAFVAGLVLAIVGLHVALNWDWILSVFRRWRAHRAEPAGGRSLAERLGLAGLGSTMGRLGQIVVVTAVVCGLSFVGVAAVARTRIDPKPRTRWAKPDIEAVPREVTVQLLVVAVSALIGRKVLRIKL